MQELINKNKSVTFIIIAVVVSISIHLYFSSLKDSEEKRSALIKSKIVKTTALVNKINTGVARFNGDLKNTVEKVLNDNALKKLSSISADVDNKINISIRNAPFLKVASFISILEKDYAITIDNLNMDVDGSSINAEIVVKS